MLFPQRTLEHLELIAGAGLIAVALLGTVVAVVGTLTYFLTREWDHSAADSPTAIPAAKAARERHLPEVPTGVAG